MEKEDGEMSDDNAMVIDDDNALGANATLLYKADKNGLVVEKVEMIDAAKLEERAKRFGLNLTGNRVVTQTQINELYENFGIESGNERHFRFDALHLSGIEGLTTKEVFEYLEDYRPVSLEKVDDISCNVVCQDHVSTALALLVHSREIRNEELKSLLQEKSPHHWREGMPHPKKDLILMRFATNGDKKMPKNKQIVKHTDDTDDYYDQSMDSVSKNPWGDLCKSWGVYDHQEVFQRKLLKNDYEDEIEEPTKIKIKNKNLAMRLGKRTQTVADQSEDNESDSEWKKKSKAPRMRMHADDEESKQMKRKQTIEVNRNIENDTYAPLSIEVVNSGSGYRSRDATKLSEKFKTLIKTEGSQKESIQSRLGVKVPPTSKEDSSNDETSSDSSDHYVMSRVQKVKQNSGTSNVWSRLESKVVPKASNEKSDLRLMLKSRKHKESDNKSIDDLRGRISKSKKSNLRIEIDNNYAH